MPDAPDGFLASVAEHGFSPGWAKREPAMWATPSSKFVPMVWRYADALQALTQAAGFVSTEMAERRNLILVNPIPGNAYPTCRHLVAAYQLVLPGETARSHRHSPNALRLVLDAAPGVYTLVDGARIDMAAGDVVLTPQWHWHGHANYSDQPAFWIDFLDVPLVQNMENMFFEHHPQSLQAVARHEPESALRTLGTTLADRTRAQTDVQIGGSLLKTIGLHAIGLSQGQQINFSARLDNNIYAVTGGEVGFTVAPLDRVVLTRGDVIVIPSWTPYSIDGSQHAGSALRVTDEPAFAGMGFRNFHDAPSQHLV